MFCEISGPLSHVAYTIVDLLIKIPGPLNPAAYWKVHNFFKRSKICQKRSNISNAPLGNLINISLLCVAVEPTFHNLLNYILAFWDLFLWPLCYLLTLPTLCPPPQRNNPPPRVRPPQTPVWSPRGHVEPRCPSDRVPPGGGNADPDTTRPRRSLSWKRGQSPVCIIIILTQYFEEDADVSLETSSWISAIDSQFIWFR